MFTTSPRSEIQDGSGRYGYRHVFLLDTLDTVSFNAVVGEQFTLTLSLNTEIASGGFESGAWPDFSHSGSYEIIAVQNPITGAPLDVQSTIVPEPSVFALIGMGFAATLKARRFRP